MDVQQLREQFWTNLNNVFVLLALFIMLSVTLFLCLLIPQSPVPLSDNVVFSRWVARIRPDLGAWTDVFATLGLLTLRNSWWMRCLLLCLSLVTTVRVITLVENWSHWPLFPRGIWLAMCLGGLFFVTGWSLQTLWGWTETGLIVWADDTTIAISNQDITLPAPDGLPLLSRDYGVFWLPQPDNGVGLQMWVEDEKGQQLQLHLSSKTPTQESLRVALTPEKPDVYFALPAEELGFRVSVLLETQETHVQVYRIASRDLITEQVFQGDGEIIVANVQVHLERLAYRKFKLVYNPGAPWMAFGSAFLGVGIVLSLVYADTFDFDAQQNVIVEDSEKQLLDSVEE